LDSPSFPDEVVVNATKDLFFHAFKPENCPFTEAIYKQITAGKPYQKKVIEARRKMGKVVA